MWSGCPLRRPRLRSASASRSRRRASVPAGVVRGPSVSGAPRFAPSSLNCTLWTPTSSDAVAPPRRRPTPSNPRRGGHRHGRRGCIRKRGAARLRRRRGVAGRVGGHDDVVVGARRQPRIGVGGRAAADGRDPVCSVGREPGRGGAVHAVLGHADVVRRCGPVQAHAAELAGRREVRRERRAA